MRHRTGLQSLRYNISHCGCIRHTMPTHHNELNLPESILRAHTK